VKLWKIINLILLYGIFQTFFNWFQFIIGDTTSFSKHYGTPIYHLWYIVSLGFWYTLAYAINKLHFNKYGKFIILLTIFVIAFLSRWYTNDIVSFMQGYIPNFSSYTLRFQRTLTFAPFLFAVFFLTKDALYNTYNLITQKTTMVLMTITMFFCFLLFDRKPVVELIYRGGFGTDRFLLPTDNFWNYTTDVFSHYLIVGWLCFLILNIVESSEGFLTKIGDRSLTIFLFHPIFIFALWQFDFFKVWGWPTQILFFFILAYFISLTLSSNTFVSFSRYLCHPYRSIAILLQRNKS